MNKRYLFLLVVLIAVLASCKKGGDKTPCDGTLIIPKITGPVSVAIGNTIKLSADMAGGKWTSGNEATATVSSDGVVTGVAAGVVAIRYYVNHTCGGSGNAQEIEVTGPVSYTIGERYGGGVIAYVLQFGDPGYDAGVKHGLIAYTEDWGTTPLVWYNGAMMVTGATGTALGTGSANTGTIVAIQGTGSNAAAECLRLVRAGYDDWYLPSKNELNRMYQHKAAIGGFGTGSYWSSSEIDADNAWSQEFGTGTTASDNKAKQCTVRPVRSF
ncbi:MAG: DUF1566 domain-containing protein [Flavipsychrobacter sp.]|nr:DUF1566 domain-containing protein [Flavipsychrobacter sp.]